MIVGNCSQPFGYMDILILMEEERFFAIGGSSAKSLAKNTFNRSSCMIFARPLFPGNALDAGKLVVAGG